MDTRPVAAFALALVAAASVAAQSGRARRVAPPPATEPTATEPSATQPASPADPATTAQPAPRKPTNASYAVKYDAGSIGLEHDEKLTIVVKDDHITLKSKTSSVDVPVDRVSEITYSEVSRNRTAEGIGVGAVNPTAGVLLGGTRKTNHYIEIVWQGDRTGGVSLHVDKNDYRGLLAALEAATGVRSRVEATPPTRDWLAGAARSVSGR